MSSNNNDQIFQLSLTEIAFMIIFLLMILLGLMVLNVTKENKELVSTLASSSDLQEREATLEQITFQFKTRLAALGVKNPDAVLSKMIEASKARDESDRLRVLLEEKDQALSALIEVEKALAQASPEPKSEETKRAIIAAVLTFEELKKLLQEKDETISPAAPELLKRVETLKSTQQSMSQLLGKDGQPPTFEQVQEIVRKADEFTQAAQSGSNPVILKKENTDLRGQIVYLQNRLNARGGIDYPPCWVDENTGKIQYLFTLELRNGDLQMEPAWPAIRQEDANALPGMQTILNNPVGSYEGFMASVKPIFEQSKAKECRFYVRLKSVIPDAVQSDRKRLLIETVFYKSEIRR